jgi:hypothetical protein
MSTIVALNPPTRAVRDPAIAAIDKYWAALKIWQAADRKVKRLKKRLPDDLTRRPRVQVSWILHGRDANGANIKEPIYAHSEWEIGDRARRDCNSMLSFHAPLYSWFVDPSAKGGIRKGVNKRGKSQRPIIRARYKVWEKEKLAAFHADKADLYERQRAAGWRQAVEAEEAARSQVTEQRYVVKNTAPTTVAGASALVGFIYIAYRSETNSRREHGPYGLGEYYTASIARRVASFLKRRTTQVETRKAA